MAIPMDRATDVKYAFDVLTGAVVIGMVITDGLQWHIMCR